jgi:hypothetical protein
MPKPLKKAAKRTSPDVNEVAFDLVRRSTESADHQAPSPALSAELSAYMKVLGSRGGKTGGKRRLETMSPERRSEVALKAARARWGKETQKKR